MINKAIRGGMEFAFRVNKADIIQIMFQRGEYGVHVSRKLRRKE